MSKNFDVFLAHSSKDKPLIRQLYRQLQERGIQPWLDEEEIAPGTQFQDEIQQAIGQIKTAAICIGQGGLGRWQALEIKTFISQCVERGIPVIPVLLPKVEGIPENLIFLQNFHAVFFRVGIDDEQALFQLEWGITGNKPTKLVVTNQAGSQAVNPGRKEIPNPLVDLGNGITLEMVNIPGGSFLMGSVPGEDGSYDDERPQHRVTIQGFSMGKYPVTQAEWRAIANRSDLKINQDLILGDSQKISYRLGWPDQNVPFG